MPKPAAKPSAAQRLMCLAYLEPSASFTHPPGPPDWRGPKSPDLWEGWQLLGNFGGARGHKKQRTKLDRTKSRQFKPDKTNNQTKTEKPNQAKETTPTTNPHSLQARRFQANVGEYPRSVSMLMSAYEKDTVESPPVSQLHPPTQAPTHCSISTCSQPTCNTFGCAATTGHLISRGLEVAGSYWKEGFRNTTPPPPKKKGTGVHSKPPRHQSRPLLDWAIGTGAPNKRQHEWTKNNHFPPGFESHLITRSSSGEVRRAPCFCCLF